jgi:GT2 family glycosyltransferase
MLSIIMLHYGDRQVDMTRRAIQHLKETTAEPYELLVWVNGGWKDESIDSIRHMAQVMGTDERLGLAAAYNLALKNATGNKVCIIHNDCFPSDGWDTILLGALSEKNIVFPTVDTNDELAAARGIPAAPKGMPPSCCFMISRKFLNELGGWDEQFEFCHFEDLDLFQRALDAGGKLVRGGTRVLHLRGVTRADQVDKANQAYEVNKYKYAEKHGYGVPYPTIGDIENECMDRRDECGHRDIPSDSI